ncbi:molybdate ABC transporter substrate-binding protein [Bacillus sp. 31A1R]|uniref:Molybdate ABC transporter substrate-binding protein n=1 Tax=Robertmurraya mangrovi TaxID=3098077 RepID=A0ABU5ITJ7_9BACI|nr:molybdate ABC transporter substrate-binding protein [Bacillus sp. 31A1R]MDZ5470456.1 molybdate ABC transporter substrate-binding protein [Bacillus sp. 31A1R]
MHNRKTFIILLPIIFVFLFIVGCNNNHEQNSNSAELQIAAASDLTLAFTELGKMFEEETGTKVTFSFGSTGQLADQIANGAPFDVFAAANVKFVDDLKAKGHVMPDSQKMYALGRIGIATVKDSSLKVTNLEDLLKPEVKKIAIANPDHAPYGLAAKQAFQAVGIWDEIETKLVYGRNISDTLTFIETGNVEAGIIALSLVKEEDVHFSLIESQLHEPIKQSIAVINGTEQERTAKEFIKFILGPTGQPVMERYGFSLPKENE